jgi:hypothetical protein
VFIDGSARWYKAESMYYLHSWTGDNSRMMYFYQANLPIAGTQLPLLKFRP